MNAHATHNGRNGPKPVVLYLAMVDGSPSHLAKMAGIRRYCALRGWEAVPVPRKDSSPELLPDLLRRHRPVGCVVEGIGSPSLLPPRLFRSVPVAYIGYLPGKTGRRPNLRFDADAIAAAALRELSSGKPSCYAVIGNNLSEDWSRRRVRAFRQAVAAAGAKCRTFPSRPGSARESREEFIERLVPWLAKLPEHCAIFAVSDETAVRVARAARAALRNIPRSLSLLSVDNFAALCEGADPPLSSIQLDFEREGFLAASLIDGECPQKTGERPRPMPLIGPLLTVRRKSTSGRGRHEKFILEAVEMIRREACEGLTAASLLRRFPVSKSLFNLRFREAVGHSVHDEILHVRLEAACSLLSRNKTAIGAIPGLCGFNCDSTLDLLFRRIFKMGMREWRKRNSRPF